VIIEVNAGPGIRMHTHPAEGRARNVAAPIVEMLYPPGVDSTIPVIAVTGTNGKTTTVRLIAHLFRVSENVVGFTTTDGTYLGNRMVIEGDMTGPFSANIILSNPTWTSLCSRLRAAEFSVRGLATTNATWELCSTSARITWASWHQHR
jgi:cyanophycin synthetase